MVEATNRKKIWTKTYETITKHNKRADKGLETYRQGLNQFSDMVIFTLELLFFSLKIVFLLNNIT